MPFVIAFGSWRTNYGVPLPDRQWDAHFPVTLYYKQWIRLLDEAQELREFLEKNKGRLKLKK
jgi:hypothetical protein